MKILNSIPIEYRPFVLPLFSILVILVLTVTVGRMILSGILESRESISALQKENELLISKRDLLASLNQKNLTDQSVIATGAVPGETPTLIALSTLRTIAAQRGVTISDARVSEAETEAKGKIKSVQFRLIIQGGLTSALSFVADLRKTSPLVRVSKFSFSQEDSSPETSLEILALWSPLPEKLGKASAPVETLTSPEQDLLKQLGGLARVQGGGLSISPPQGRVNPFSF